MVVKQTVNQALQNIFKLLGEDIRNADHFKQMLRRDGLEIVPTAENKNVDVVDTVHNYAEMLTYHANVAKEKGDNEKYQRLTTAADTATKAATDLNNIIRRVEEIGNFKEK